MCTVAAASAGGRGVGAGEVAVAQQVPGGASEHGGDIRQKMIEDNLVSCIVGLPCNMFRSSAIPACLWFLAKDRGRTKTRTVLWLAPEQPADGRRYTPLT
jgi:type I restriction enzyme M protein